MPCPAGPRTAPCSAKPVDGRLFFAGEATSPHFFSTAHGAYESGVRAASELASSIGLGLETSDWRGVSKTNGAS